MCIYCLFHSDLDGYVAASQFYGKFGKDAQYYPVNYGEAFPLKDVELTKDDTVYVVDFSYDAEFSDYLADITNLIVLDHHKTAYEKLKGKPYFTYSSECAGCLMAFNYVSGGLNKPIPDAVVAANAYDLWLDSKDEAEAAYLDLNKANFPFLLSYSRKDHLDKIKTLGKYRDYIISELTKDTRIKIKEDSVGRKYAILNIVYPFTSTGLNLMFAKYPEICYAIGYNFDAAGISVSFRGNGAIDVSEIAKLYGGGGHFAAAACRIRKIEELCL